MMLPNQLSIRREGEWDEFGVVLGGQRGSGGTEFGFVCGGV
jgi:hypothetical protein